MWIKAAAVLGSIPKFLRQAERLLAVHDAEIDCFSLMPLFPCHLFKGDIENLRGGESMDILIGRKALIRMGSSLKWARRRSSIWE